MNKNILLIDKPKDWTSFDVVAKIRNAYRKATGNKKAKVGHAGTLDPFATGLLIVLLGDATKKQDSFMKLDKEYVATLKLGFTSATGDPEGEIAKFPNCKLQISKDDIEHVIQNFIGEIEQTPPAYSAIKVDGKRAYKLARQGEIVKLEPRKVIIHTLEIIKYRSPNLELRVKCSSGTYIRSLAEDIGKELGCGAYLTELKRTKIGEFEIGQAISVELAIEQLGKSQE